MGITVLFEEDLSEEEILAIGDEIGRRNEIKEIRYTSAEEAWETFKTEYFAGNEELAEGFSDDNPLAGSASYSIFLKDIESQDVVVGYLEGIDGVRQVNYSNSADGGIFQLKQGDRDAVVCDHRRPVCGVNLPY